MSAISLFFFFYLICFFVKVIGNPLPLVHHNQYWWKRQMTDVKSFFTGHTEDKHGVGMRYDERNFKINIYIYGENLVHQNINVQQHQTHPSNIWVISVFFGGISLRVVGVFTFYMNYLCNLHRLLCYYKECYININVVYDCKQLLGFFNFGLQTRFCWLFGFLIGYSIKIGENQNWF